MAYIGHRCDCGHTDLQHRNNGTSKTLGSCTANCGLSCGFPCGATPEPQVIPTFDGHGRPVERVIAPGGGLPAMGDVDVLKTCPCDACVALYEQLVPAA
jgi:hypothetical protein